MCVCVCVHVYVCLVLKLVVAVKQVKGDHDLKTNLHAQNGLHVSFVEARVASASCISVSLGWVLSCTQMLEKLDEIELKLK